MATITIPAGYLEDARNGALELVASDGNTLLTADLQDRDMSATILERDHRLATQLLNAAGGEQKVTAEDDNMSNPLLHMLEEMVRKLSARLDDAKDYGPVPMGTVLDIAAELRWAAEQAIRLNPHLRRPKGGVMATTLTLLRELAPEPMSTVHATLSEISDVLNRALPRIPHVDPCRAALAQLAPSLNRELDRPVAAGLAGDSSGETGPATGGEVLDAIQAILNEALPRIPVNDAGRDSLQVVVTLFGQRVPRYPVVA